MDIKIRHKLIEIEDRVSETDKICGHGVVSVSCPYQIRMIFNQIIKIFDSIQRL